MTSKKDLLRRFLSGIETGDAMAAAVVDEDRYVQHNPMTGEGGPGIAALFAKLAQTNPKVRFVRVFEDGDFAFAHNEYDFSQVRAAFEVFRFEDGQAVEHWDNIQTLAGPNPSGRGMLDGETAICDLDRTEANRAAARAFATDVLIGRDLARMEQAVAPDLIQHNPHLPDGCDAWRRFLGDVEQVRYDRLHRVLAEGNFALCMSEGSLAGAHTAFYDLLRFQAGQIVEHWDTVEAIAPRDQWKNQNGKF